MAQRVITQLIDDLDQESEAAATVAFGWDECQYEIDLNDAHAAELRDAFAPHVGAARRRRPGAARDLSLGAGPLPTFCARAPTPGDRYWFA